MHVEVIVTAVIAVFASTGFWQFVLSRTEHKETHKDALTEGVLGLLHCRLYELARRTIKRNGITDEELDELENLYVPYARLGGNGTGHRLYDRAKNLPLIDDESEVE